ncbi:LysM peptidoglycan-binding domain-containing protein [Streptomyces sp. NPDC088847]|uniref:LysM peptidoglycan-binding domain-containing protein n=1 Tax=Streptomyces sp. NPDC088847 TaxID=3365909 RepID=UPI0037F88F13
MRTPPSPAAAHSLTARIVTAAGSLLVLAGAVAGLPLLLAWVSPVLWATGHDDLTHLLDRQDTGGAFLLLLVAMGWIAWAQFTFCAVQELSAQLRGRSWRAPRGLGASQRAAAVLIGGILVLLPAGSALASPAQASPSAAAVRLPGQAPTHAGTDRAASAAASTQHATYTVREIRPAESLWSIAEKELGDGERWREIADLNEGRTMAGGETFRANSFLQPGWQLDMPTAATAEGGLRAQTDGSVPVSGDESTHMVTVRSGEYLSMIAQDELGDGNAWPRLFAASRGTPWPHGLPAISDPEVIYAGQQITVPGVSFGHQTPPSGDGDETGGTEATPPASKGQHPGTGAVGEQTPALDAASTPTASSAPSHILGSAPASQAPGPRARVRRPRSRQRLPAVCCHKDSTGVGAAGLRLLPHRRRVPDPGTDAGRQSADLARRARRRSAAGGRRHRRSGPAADA